MSFKPPGPPYPPTTASLGGLPTKGVDIPISSVFLLLFLVGAISHMTIFVTNYRRNHKFIISGVIFGFCMTRITAQVMRIVWACRPRNVKVALVANIFTAAGVLLLFVTNLLFAQRVFKAMHPRSGWHSIFTYSFTALYVLIVLTLAMLITSVIQSSFTLNSNTKRIDRDILLYGQTFFAVVSFLPIPIVIIGLLMPRRSRLEKFGRGRWRHKIWILLASSAALCLGASFRAGSNYAGGKRPITNPARYQSKACFYIFNYAIEIVVVFLYILVRVDERFWVPNGSKGPGDYTGKGPEVKRDADVETSGDETLARVMHDEETTLDGTNPEDIGEHEKGMESEKGEASMTQLTRNGADNGSGTGKTGD
ncbi:MAG: hypothetical protein Q9201_002384 [Fulgogasparrea decipioides]